MRVGFPLGGVGGLVGQLLSNGKASFWQISGPWLLVAQTESFGTAGETVKTENGATGHLVSKNKGVLVGGGGGYRRGSTARNRAWALHTWGLPSTLHWVAVNTWVFGCNLTPSSYPAPVFLPPLHLFTASGPS